MQSMSFSNQEMNQGTAIPTDSSAIHKLIYRGITYEMSLQYHHSAYTLDLSKAEMTNTGLFAMFLGQTYPIQRPVRSYPTQSPVTLKYRGLSYS